MTGLLEVLEQSRDRGFLGPGPVEAHVEHADAFVAACAPPPSRFLDLGSGGGVPGLILALRWPAASGVLLDAQLRRVRFLDAALEQLGIADRIVAMHGRAEELAWDDALRGAFDVVTARSFAGPAVTAESAAGFLRRGGRLVVAEPPDEPQRWSADGLASVGLEDLGLVRATASAVRVLSSSSGPQAGVPRRAAAMQRRPRF